MEKIRLSMWFWLMTFLFLAPFAKAQIAATNTADPSAWKNPDYAPSGIRYGSFLGFSGLAVDTIYDDNIFRTQNKTSDLITIAKPSVFIKSDWALHALAFGAEGDFALYRSHNSENYSDYDFFASGQYDLDYETFFNAEIRQKREHEDRGSPEDPDGDHPLQYKTTSYSLGFTRALGVLKAFLSASYKRVRFASSEISGALIDNGFRDHDDKRLETKLAYELSPVSQVFISTAYQNTAYLESGPLDRSSQGYDTKAGFSLDITGKVKEDFYGGYLYRNYGRNFENISAGFFGSTLDWNVTDLTLLSLALDKTINETTVTGHAGNIHTMRRLNLLHALNYSMGIKMYGGIDDFDYTGDPTISNRKDRLYYGGAGFEYTLRPGLSAGLGYSRSRRQSDTAANEFTDNRLLLTLKYIH